MKKFAMLITSIVNMAVTAICIALSPVDIVASHYDAYGVADAFTTKWINFTFTAFLVLIGIIHMIVHILSSRYENGRKNIKYVDKVIWAIFLSFLTLFWMFIIASISGTTEMGDLMPLAILAAIGALMVYMGNLFPKLKQNGWFGIRTSATLSDETVWKKTHKLGGYCGVLAGLIMIGMAVWGLITDADGQNVMLAGIFVFVVLGAVVPSVFAGILSLKKNNWE